MFLFVFGINASVTEGLQAQSVLAWNERVPVNDTRSHPVVVAVSLGQSQKQARTVHGCFAATENLAQSEDCSQIFSYSFKKIRIPGLRVDMEFSNRVVFRKQRCATFNAGSIHIA